MNWAYCAPPLAALLLAASGLAFAIIGSKRLDRINKDKEQ